MGIGIYKDERGIMIDTSDLEHAIIGGLMLDDTDQDLIDELSHENFVNEFTKKIFKVFEILRKRELPIDATMVSSVLSEDHFKDRITPKDVYDLACTAPSTRNIKAYVHTLLELRRRDGCKIK